MLAALVAPLPFSLSAFSAHSLFLLFTPPYRFRSAQAPAGQHIMIECNMTKAPPVASCTVKGDDPMANAAAEQFKAMLMAVQ